MKTVQVIQGNTETVETVIKELNNQWQEAPKDLTWFEVFLGCSNSDRSEVFFLKKKTNFWVDWKVLFELLKEDTIDIPQWTYYLEIKIKKYNFVSTILQTKIVIKQSYVKIDE